MAPISKNFIQDDARVAFRELSKKSILRQDNVAAFLFSLCALVSLFVTLGIIYMLSRETWSFFHTDATLSDFLFGKTWTPFSDPRAFGVLPLLSGTLLVAAIAGIVAVPLGLAVAVYLSEYAKSYTRAWMKPLLDLLAGIPSVVYGFFAVAVLTPLLQEILPDLGFFNALSAGLVVGVMVLPIVVSLTEESLRAVPKELREAAYALGIKKKYVIRDVVLRAGSSGVVSAFLLGLARALGETMAVTLAAGSTPQLTMNPLEGIQTLTAYIAQVSLGDTPHGSPEYKSMFAVAALLFFITFFLNIIARTVVKKMRIVYE